MEEDDEKGVGGKRKAGEGEMIRENNKKRRTKRREQEESEQGN